MITTNLAEKLITIEIPVSIPSLNTLYRTGMRGRVYKSDAAREFEQFCRRFKRRELLSTPFRMEIDLGVSRMCDIDNRLKVLLDALESVVYVNDNQCYSLTATRTIRPGSAHTTVRIYY